ALRHDGGLARDRPRRQALGQAHHQFFWTKQAPPAALSVSHSWSASLLTPNGPIWAAKKMPFSPKSLRRISGSRPLSIEYFVCSVRTAAWASASLRWAETCTTNPPASAARDAAASGAVATWTPPPTLPSPVDGGG